MFLGARLAWRPDLRLQRRTGDVLLRLPLHSPLLGESSPFPSLLLQRNPRCYYIINGGIQAHLGLRTASLVKDETRYQPFSLQEILPQKTRFH